MITRQDVQAYAYILAAEIAGNEHQTNTGVFTEPPWLALGRAVLVNSCQP